MVALAAARPPWSAPGCQSGPESNRSQLRGFVPASFMGPRSKTQGRSGGNQDSIEHLFASQEGSPASLYVPGLLICTRAPVRIVRTDQPLVERTSRIVRTIRDGGHPALLRVAFKKSQPYTGRRAGPAAKPHGR